MVDVRLFTAGLTIALSLLVAQPVGAQVTPPSAGSNSAIAPNPPQPATREAAQAICRDESQAKGLKGVQRIDDTRACMLSRYPKFALPEPEFLVRRSCGSEARLQGLPRGPEREAAIAECVARKRPDIAKADKCRSEARLKRLVPRTHKYRVFMRACRAA